MAKNIVILGAGFAGIRCALKFEKSLSKPHKNEWSVILIDKNTYHTYTPALYEAATAYNIKEDASGSKEEFEELLGSSVCLPIQSIIKGKNIEFTQQEVSGIDFVSNIVQTKEGDTIPFDYLILALGSEVMCFDIPGVRERCYSLKATKDALKIRRKIKDVFLRSDKNRDIKIVMIGGGFSGVELISEIATYIKHIVGRYNIDYSKIKLFLMEARDKILMQASTAQRRAVEKRLKQLGVEILTNTKITEALPGCVMLSPSGGSTEGRRDEKCDADVVLWGGGVKGPSIFSKLNNIELDKRGRVATDEFLRVKGFKNVFAVGDNAYFVNKAGEEAPATVFIAEQQADTIAHNIRADLLEKPLLEYRIFIPGYVTSCGGKYAVAHIYGVTFSGFWGWVLKKIIDLKYFLSLLPIKKALPLWLRELRLFTRND